MKLPRPRIFPVAYFPGQVTIGMIIGNNHGMKRMSIEANVAMTEKHLAEIAAGADARAESDGEQQYRTEMAEIEPTAKDLESGRATAEQRKFDHGSAVSNILRTVDEDEERAEKVFSWRQKREFLRNALSELDQSLAIEPTDDELNLRERIVERAADMDRFLTDSDRATPVTDTVNELLDSPGAYRDAMKEAWAATLEDPAAMRAVNGNWLQLYEQAERALIDAVKKEDAKRLSFDEARVWYRYILEKLDAAEAIMPDEIAHDMKAFVLRRLREIETRVAARR